MKGMGAQAPFMRRLPSCAMALFFLTCRTYLHPCEVPSMDKAWGSSLRSFVLLVCAFVVGVVVPPAAAAPAAELDWKVTEETLTNGLKVLLLEDHHAPIISQQV